MNYIDCEHLIKGPSLFKEVTEEAQDFYIANAVKENAIISQFADEAKGVKSLLIMRKKDLLRMNYEPKQKRIN